MALNSAKEKLIDDPNFKPTNLPNQKLTNSILENMETNKK